jgi:hypothetical protein
MSEMGSKHAASQTGAEHENESRRTFSSRRATKHEAITTVKSSPARDSSYACIQIPSVIFRL